MHRNELSITKHLEWWMILYTSEKADGAEQRRLVKQKEREVVIKEKTGKQRERYTRRWRRMGL